MGLMFLFGDGTSPIFGETTTTIAGKTRVFLPLKSMKTLKVEGLIMQAYDYSCGAAALATLLTYGLGDMVTEKEILDQMLAELSKDQEARRKKEGLSLLDLQKAAHTRGHKAEGFRIAPQFLSRLGGPVLVYIKPRGYDHFAILKGVQGNRAYISDPSLGNLRMPMYEFLNVWLDENGKGVIFVVEQAKGKWPDQYLLQIKSNGNPQPEILSARQLFQVGNLKNRIPQLLQFTP